MDSSALLERCAPDIPARLMHALVRVESAWRPLAIGMDAGEGAVSQPQTLAQAVAQAKALTSAGRTFSVGLAQIHAGNVTRFGMSWEQAFDPCLNLEAGQRVLKGFYRDALAAGHAGLAATHAALRGYNAGAIDRSAGSGYARRVVGYAQGRAWAAQVGTSGLALDASTSTSMSMPMPMPFGFQPGASGNNAEPPASATRRGEALDLFTKRSAIPGF